MTKKAPKPDQKDQKIAELTADLQRQRADFENYRKNADERAERMQQAGAETMVQQLLPIFDNLARALQNVPAEMQDNAWVQGVVALDKSLAKLEAEIGLAKIAAAPGTPFNPELHHAVHMLEGEGETEVVADELQTGYQLNGRTIREAMVSVKNA